MRALFSHIVSILHKEHFQHHGACCSLVLFWHFHQHGRSVVSAGPHEHYEVWLIESLFRIGGQDRPDDVPTMLHSRAGPHAGLPRVVADVAVRTRQQASFVVAPAVGHLAGKLAERLGRTGVKLDLGRGVLVNEVLEIYHTAAPAGLTRRGALPGTPEQCLVCSVKRQGLQRQGSAGDQHEAGDALERHGLAVSGMFRNV
mmetsp:Transcript_3474/g.9786  ORF Transcript_3474/g.9786 Transcript_3474/m.9786 type:complete len:200 (+) Transcript_3474:632-1231(+)